MRILLQHVLLGSVTKIAGGLHKQNMFVHFLPQLMNAVKFLVS